MTVSTTQQTFTLPVQVILDAAPSGMMMVDGEGMIVMVNRLLSKQFGYLMAELVGRPVERLMPDRFQVNHPGHIKDFFSQPESRPMGSGRDLYGKRKDGTEFPVEIGLNPLNYQGKTYVFASLVDITEKKKEAERVAVLSHRLLLATQSANLGIWEWDVIKNKLFWDNQMYALYGLAKEVQSEPYSTWVQALHPEDRKTAEGALQLALQGKQDFDIQFRVIWPDQTIHWMHGAGAVDTGVP